MSRFFLDASFVIAAKLARDQHHRDVATLWPNLLQSRTQITTSAFVLNEVVTYLNSRGKHSAAVELGDILLTSPQIEFVLIDHDLLNAAWDYFIRHQDKSYSFADCASFVIMNERGIRHALAFDHHFAQAGFECLPAANTP